MVKDTVSNGLVFDRENDFDPALEVASHPICGARVKTRLGKMGALEIKYSAMLKEAAKDTAHANIFADAFESRDQPTYASNDEADTDTGARSRVQVVDRLFIDK